MRCKNLLGYFLCFGIIGLLFPGFTFSDSAKIKNLLFTTSEQTLGVGVLSEALTIQTQNDSGASEKIDETNDVTFSSTSATGEFLGSTGKPVTTYMSKNTASKTFYYRDTTEGVYTISVLIKGRDTGKTFGASQKVTVGSGGGGGVLEEDKKDEEGGSTTGTQTSESGVGSSFSDESSHSSSAPLSDIKDDFDFKVDAGRKRVVSVNSPITFNAKIAEAPKGIGAKYFWSFGDGSSKKGKDVTHTYLFPGEYNVLLTVEMGESSAVSKTKVKVFEPKVSIEDVSFGKGGFVTIRNNTSAEVNLDGWMVFYGKISFTFPQDTIVDKGTTLKVPFAFTKSFEGEEVKLLYPNKIVISKFSQMNEELASLTKELAVLEEGLRRRQEYVVQKEILPPITLSIKEEEKKSTTTASNAPNQILIDTYVAEKKEDSMLAYPGKIFRKIKSMLFGE